jgi:hypothetical protein
MADSIKINLDTSLYIAPTLEDIYAAKQFILQRGETARVLVSRIDELLDDAIEKITEICYKYNVDPELLYFSSAFNEQMMDEIAEVMDELENAILDLIYEYATRATNNRTRMIALANWMALLGRGNRNLRDTLEDYLYKFLKDLEAAIAALRYADVDVAAATTKIKTYKHTIYTMPEMLAAFKHAEDFTATYVRNRGVQKGGAGLSNNGSTNVTNMASTTLQMAWMRSMMMDYDENGVAGVYILRGSNYPCEICDAVVGLHMIKDAYSILPVHPHCCCYAVPIYKKDIQNL